MLAPAAASSRWAIIGPRTSWRNSPGASAISRSAAERPVFYQVGPQSLPLFLDMGLSALKLGEVARVDLLPSSSRARRCRTFAPPCGAPKREGLLFEIIGPDAVAAEMAELRTVSNAWLENKAGSEKGFSLGYFDETYLSHFDMAIMRKDGAIVAFANLWRGADKVELSIDLMRFLPDVSRVSWTRCSPSSCSTARKRATAGSTSEPRASGLVDRRGASRWKPLRLVPLSTRRQFLTISTG